MHAPIFIAIMASIWKTDKNRYGIEFANGKNGRMFTDIKIK